MALIRSLVGGLVGGILANNPAVVCYGLGVLAGIYAEQTYHLPPLEQELHKYVERVKEWEKELRK